MSPEYILQDLVDHVLTITLNRPEKLNAVTEEGLRGLWEAITQADEDPETRAIVVTGAGRAFCAGADLGSFQAALEESKRLGRQVTSVDQEMLEQFAYTMSQLGTPIIAAINGPAMGIGFTFTLGCDIRIASEGATLGAVFLQRGLSPEFGSTFNLPRLIGIAKACELVFSARVVGAQEAKEIGLVNQVVPPEQLMPVSTGMAQTIAALPPLAMRYAKKNLYSGLQGGILDQLHMETLANRACRDTEDYHEGVMAFLEKRPAVFRGR